MWRDWEEGIAGKPALQDFEKIWGHLLRLKSKDRTAWSRRKVIVDEVARLVASGRTEGAAIAHLEVIRAGRHLRRLVHELKVRQKAKIQE